MKGRPLISFILLLTLVIIILPTAAQANEYREVNTEVKAEDIVKHIENGEDINLTNCRIFGELNTSNIMLKTVTTPYFYKFMIEGWDKETVVERRTSENLTVVESNIQIKNSVFERHLDFSNTVFNAPINFNESTFNDTADFSKSIFNDTADFSESTFNDTADFSESTFNATTNFNRARFHSNVYFNESIFNGSAYLYGAIFNDFAGFESVTFNAPTFFSPFTEPLRHVIIVTPTKFYGHADFSLSTFNAQTSFHGLIFHNFADFSVSTFNGSTDFGGSVFNAPVDFDYSTFNGDVNFCGATFNFSGDLSGPKQFKKIITNNEKVCDFFRRFYKNEARYDDADNIYYEYRKVAMDSKSLTTISKWSDFLGWITCGYGLKPLRIFWPGIFVVGVFALLYWRWPGIYRSSDAVEKKSNVSVWDALYFSINTFTTLGSADWYPRDSFRKLVTLEGLLGWIMLGIFMATLTNVMIRS